MTWEDYDSNGVRANYGTDYNKWETRYWVPVLSNNWICMYSWKITSIVGSYSPNAYQSLIYNKDWELIYYASRLITRSLVQQAENERKNTIVTTNQIAINTQTVVQNTTNSQNNLEEYNKAIEDAKKAIALKQASIVPIDTTVSTPNVIATTKKLSPSNERKATVLKKRIQLLKKQLEILERQLESL
jgi:hypothetical protein